MLSCQQHDYIEIICMYQYPVTITMSSGEKFSCKALDTQLNSERKECIKVEHDSHSKLIILDDIQCIEVGVDNPHFSHITLK